MQLGLKRAETVKAELLNAGVDEHRMKMMSLGEEGVLCVDTSDICRHVNRRVHLEIRKFGQEHMAAPAAATSADPAEAGVDASFKAHDIESSTDNLQSLNPELVPGS
jgi:peptidoglycan-associated lipoprotein